MGQRLSDNEEMQNIRQLGEFLGYWRQSTDYPSENSGNDHISFPVTVMYEWQNGTKKKGFSSVFRAFIGSGPEDGTIDLDGTPSVTVDLFHLHFIPRFQKFEYAESSHAFSITDTSDKMGRYSVLITPDLQHP